MPKLPKSEQTKTEITTVVTAENAQFPSISRFIPEKLKVIHQRIWYPKLFLVSFLSGLLLLGIFLQIHTLLANIQQLKQQNQQRISSAQEINYWKEITQKYPGYGDAYLKLASLEYKLGHTDEARQYIEKAFTIDPNSQEGKVLGAKIHATIK